MTRAREADLPRRNLLEGLKCAERFVPGGVVLFTAAGTPGRAERTVMCWSRAATAARGDGTIAACWASKGRKTRESNADRTEQRDRTQAARIRARVHN